MSHECLSQKLHNCRGKFHWWIFQISSSKSCHSDNSEKFYWYFFILKFKLIYLINYQLAFSKKLKAKSLKSYQKVIWKKLFCFSLQIPDFSKFTKCVSKIDSYRDLNNFSTQQQAHFLSIRSQLEFLPLLRDILQKIISVDPCRNIFLNLDFQKGEWLILTFELIIFSVTTGLISLFSIWTGIFSHVEACSDTELSIPLFASDSLWSKKAQKSFKLE